MSVSGAENRGRRLSPTLPSREISNVFSAPFIEVPTLGPLALTDAFAAGSNNSFHNLISLTSQKFVPEWVARTPKTGIPAREFEQLLSQLPSRIVTPQDGGYFLDFTGVAKEVLVILDTTLNYLAPVNGPADIVGAAHQIPYKSLFSAALTAYLAQDSVIARHLNPPLGVVAKFDETGQFYDIFAIEQRLGPERLDLISEYDNKAERLLLDPNGSIQTVAFVLERIYRKFGETVIGDLKPEHFLYQGRDIKITDLDAAFFPGMTPPQIPRVTTLFCAPENYINANINKATQIAEFSTVMTYVETDRLPRGPEERYQIGYIHSALLVTGNNLPLFHNHSESMLASRLIELGINISDFNFYSWKRSMMFACGTKPEDRPGSFTLAAYLATEPLILSSELGKPISKVRRTLYEIVASYFNAQRSETTRELNPEAANRVLIRQQLAEIAPKHLFEFYTYLTAGCGAKPRSSEELVEFVLEEIERRPI